MMGYVCRERWSVEKILDVSAHLISTYMTELLVRYIEASVPVLQGKAQLFQAVTEDV